MRLEMVKQYYGPCLAAGGPRPLALKAYEDTLEYCRQERLPAVLVWMPEASEFRGWYPPDVERWGGELYADFGSRPGVHLLDARGWLPDDMLLDSFHLTPDGATAFTARLRRELPALAAAPGE